MANLALRGNFNKLLPPFCVEEIRGGQRTLRVQYIQLGGPFYGLPDLVGVPKLGRVHVIASPPDAIDVIGTSSPLLKM